MSTKNATTDRDLHFEVVDFDQESPAEMEFGDVFDNRLIGQPQARQIALDVRARYRNPMRNKKMPLGIFYLVGKSRRGKSLLAQVLAEMFHGDEDALVRITSEDYYDDSQMMDLIGAPPKYVGFRAPVDYRNLKPEKLAQVDGYSKVSDWNRARVRMNSGALIDIVVLEEFAKSGADFYKFWMEVFDKGKKTLGNGEVVDFTNTVFIITDNLGMDKVEKEESGSTIGFISKTKKCSHEEIETIVHAEMKRRYKPEFRNRIDTVVVYRDLTADETLRIVDIEVNRISDRIIDQMPRGDDFTLEVTSEARKFLLKEADEDVANLKRTLIKHIEVPMGRILDKDNPDRVLGGDLVRVSWDGKSAKLTFAIARGAGDYAEGVESLKLFHGDNAASHKGMAMQRRIQKARMAAARAEKEDWSVTLKGNDLDDLMSEGSAMFHELKEIHGLKVCNFSMNYEAPYLAVYVVRGTKEQVDLVAQSFDNVTVKPMMRTLVVVKKDK